MKKSDPKLEQLKSLLLADELARFEKLVSKVEHLEFETLDEGAIKQKLLPLFDDLLLERLQGKDARTIAILSEHLSDVIAQSVVEDPHKLSAALKPVIIPAISEGIANNKEQMIDALYPIMGGMISKYVTQAIKEMMETINRKIEQGFSVERYKRKLKAKFTGVSESELLLEESADARLDAMFTIQKETGLLISEAHLEESQIGDPHMVASMASAIKDFINDWIADNKESADEIQILSYGNATLYIESAGSVYLIAFLDSEPDYEQRTQINHFFGTLIEKYATFFQHFNGDERVPEVSELSEKMQAYLRSLAASQGEMTTDAIQKGNPAKYLFLGVGILLAGYVGYELKSIYEQRMMLSQITEKTGEHLKIEEQDGKYVISGLIHDQAHTGEIRKIVQHYYPNDAAKLDLGLSIKAVESGQSKIQQQYAKMFEMQQRTIASLEDTLKHEHKINEERLEKIEDTMAKQSRERAIREKIVKLSRIPKEIGNALENVLGDSPYYDSKRMVLNFSSLHFFGAGKSEPQEDKMRVVETLFQQYLTALEPYMPYIKQITVRSFSDSSGSEEDNLRLTSERALMVRENLLQAPGIKGDLIANRLLAEGKGESMPVLINGVEDPEASRRVEIGFVVDQEKIKRQIEALHKGAQK